jgi:hypothetical protein
MPFSTAFDFCVLDSCLETGGVKGGGREVDGGFAYLVGRVVRDP